MIESQLPIPLPPNQSPLTRIPEKASAMGMAKITACCTKDNKLQNIEKETNTYTDLPIGTQIRGITTIEEKAKFTIDVSIN